MGKIMKSFRTKKWLKGLMLAMLLIVGSTVFSASAKEVQAATAGFKTIDGKTYYIKSDGSKQKGLADPWADTSTTLTQRPEYR